MNTTLDFTPLPVCRMGHISEEKLDKTRVKLLCTECGNMGEEFAHAGPLGKTRPGYIEFFREHAVCRHELGAVQS